MTTKAKEWHEANLSALRSTANGNRNSELNKQAMKSFQLALANDNNLSVSQVEADYTALAESIGLTKTETRKTLESALAGAKDNPRQETTPNSKPASNGTLDNSPATSQRVQLARTHKEWAEDHGATIETFTNAKWEMKEHNGRPAWLIPCPLY
jgi:hypothetical protein